MWYIKNKDNFFFLFFSLPSHISAYTVYICEAWMPNTVMIIHGSIIDSIFPPRSIP